MNREIKFRVWDKENKKFDDHKDALLLMLGQRTFEMGFNTKQGIYPIPETGQKNLGRNRWVLQQYTGLKDRNGTEIYEGDILNLYIEWTDDYKSIGVVVFEEGGFLIKESNWNDSWTRRYNWKYSEIIGNIFENKDLLKDGHYWTKLKEK